MSVICSINSSSGADFGLEQNKSIFMEVNANCVAESCCKPVFRNKHFLPQRIQLFLPDEKCFME